MTASVSLPATTASTASRCPGRSSEKPKTSRATRSMAGGTAWGMCHGKLPSGFLPQTSCPRFPRLWHGYPNRAGASAYGGGVGRVLRTPIRGGDRMFERLRARRFQRDHDRDGEPADRGGVATAERDRDETRIANGDGDGH